MVDRKSDYHIPHGPEDIKDEIELTRGQEKARPAVIATIKHPVERTDAASWIEAREEQIWKRPLRQQPKSSYKRPGRTSTLKGF